MYKYITIFNNYKLISIIYTCIFYIILIFINYIVLYLMFILRLFIFML